MIHVNFKMFVDKPGVMAAIDRKRLRVLSQAGAYSRVAMQRMIRPPKTGKKATRITVNGVELIVPPRGMVLSAKTRKPVTTELAREARIAMSKRRHAEEPNRPPRRGPTDLLRRFIFFGIDKDTQSVVIGPQKFAKQPQMTGATSVPELLERGGTAKQWAAGLGSVTAYYAPHPYVGPTLPIAERRFKELIEREPLK